MSDTIITFTRDVFSGCDVFHLSHGNAYVPSQLLNSAADLRRLITDLTVALAGGDSSGLQGGQWLETTGQNDVAGCSWQKDTESPTGVLNVTLFPNKNYVDEIKPDDLLVVFMQGEYAPESRRLVTVALVDRVTEARNVTGDGATVISFHVSARDLGKILLETQLVMDPSFADVEDKKAYWQFLATLQQKYSGSPVEIVLTLLTTFFTAQTGNSVVADQWRLPGTPGAALFDLLDITTFVQVPMFGYLNPGVISLSTSGNVWNLCHAHANKVVNEFFIDVRDVDDVSLASIAQQSDLAASFVDGPGDVDAQKALVDLLSHGTTEDDSLGTTSDLSKLGSVKSIAALVFRQTPWDLDSFDALPTTVIEETEVGDTDFGCASHEVFNFFRLRSPVLSPEYQEVIYGIPINRASIMAHGIKRMEAETSYPFAGSKFASDYDTGAGPKPLFQTAYNYYVMLLATWHAYNDRLRAGSMSLKYLRPDIRVGTKLRYVRTKIGSTSTETIDFYVQGVHHNYAWTPGSSTTTLTLVRGIVRDDQNRPENNLVWSPQGMAIPLEFNPYTVVTATGFKILGVESTNGQGA